MTRLHPVALFALALTAFVLLFVDSATLALLVVLVAVPLAWIVTAILWYFSLGEPNIRTLRERSIAATALAVIVTVFAVVFINNDLPVPLLTIDQTRIITRGVLFIAVTVSSIYWLDLTLRRRAERRR